MRNYEAIEAFITGKLNLNLSKNLHYHDLGHTNDVLHAAELIGADEKLSEQDFFLLKVAILYHDSGFMVAYKQHEEESCKQARADLPGFGLNAEEIEIICGMIMATKIPQKPKTQLEKIIADADLEYLGTDSFDKISDSLFEEAKIYLGVKTRKQWDEIQVKFISKHHYFTPFCIKNREPEKQKHLLEIRSRLS
jgi:uncharacterized protein